MLKFTIRTLFLLTVWFLISGHFTFLPVLPGVLGLLLTSYLIHRTEVKTNSFATNNLNPLSFAFYMVFLLKEIIKSNISVAIAVLKGNTQTELVTIDAKFKNEQAKVLLANSITVTPGTMTVGIEKDHLIIHCLTSDTKEGVKSLDFNKKIAKLEK